MEKKRNFKVLVVGKDGRTRINDVISNTNDTLSTGNAQRSDPPVKENKLVAGLEESNAKGEAVKKKATTVATRKTTKNPKGSGTKPKARDKSFYPNHVFNNINGVDIVLIPNSTVVIKDYEDFIHATQDEERANDIVDILPPLYPLHFSIIQDVDKRVMIGDEVNLNFKYRSTIELKAIQQKETRTIKEIKLVNLRNMTVIVAYLDNDDYFPINELDHVRT